MTDALLAVRDLQKHYPITEGFLRRQVGAVRAVDGISFDLREGETLGLVGESGCGKSTAATTLLGLEEPTGGAVYFDGDDLSNYSKAEWKRFRRRAQMVFQDPESSFDPRMTIGESVAEPLVIHGMRDEERRTAIVADLLERVGLSASDADSYPHEFSGGEKQRIALARALVLNPDLLVCDEPVSALDVSVQADILALLSDLQDEFGVSVLFISHDMGVVRQVCDRVAVMYLGEIVEKAPTESLFSDPQHPYTRALLSAIPDPDPRHRRDVVELTGNVPDPADPPEGCRFHTRCPEVIQPDGYEFDQANWRAVMDLRSQLRADEVDLDALRERVAAEGGAADPEEVTGTQVRAELRAEYGIPPELTDPDAERVVAAALDDVASGDPETAEERFAAEFGTVCIREHPDLGETDAGHPAACHLHDSSVEATPTIPPADD